MRTMWQFRATAAGTISIAIQGTMLTCALFSTGAMASSLNQDDIAQLVKQGDAQPLAKLLERHRPRINGRMIDLELEYEQQRLVYELKVIDQHGVVREYLIDAQSGEWLGQEQ